MIMIAVVSPLRAEIETTVGADLVSEYIWRGAKCGDAAIQPTLGVSMAGIDLSFWGSVGVTFNPCAEMAYLVFGISF